MKHKLFPTDLSDSAWVEFSAEGFSKPVIGMIHRVNHPAVCGMPLGGIDTGCLDLETDGTFGYCSIFNSLSPRRGPMNMPFLGLAVGSETWILTSKNFQGELFEGISTEKYSRAQCAKEIHYWGHYPVADLEYELDGPVGVGLRAWSPFIPGDTVSSNTPGAIFEVRLLNLTDSTQKGKLVFSFPGPSPQEVCGITKYTHAPIFPANETKFSGVFVTNENNIGYAIGVIGKESIHTGGDLGIDGTTWSWFGSRPWYVPSRDELPAEVGQAGSSIGVDFELKAKEEKVVRFVLAWYNPQWNGGGTPMVGGNTYTHMYASRYKHALEVAQFLAERHQSLMDRILSWQQVIYSEKKLPVWLRESLLNVLHIIARDSVWAVAKPPIPDWVRPEDGLFATNECPRACPQMECIPNSFLGNMPIVYFFPELALSTLRGYKGYQYPDGAAPWIFGGCTGGTGPWEMAMPSRGYQTTLNGLCYAGMVDRLSLCTGDDDLLKEFYPSVKQNTIFTMNLNRGPDGIISMPDRMVSVCGTHETEWIEHCEWAGMVTHVGGIHLAQLRIAERMARKMGDKEFARQCREWFKQGSKSLEEKMWAGQYYLNFWEPDTGKKSDLIFAYQLDGEWIARFHGLSGVFRPERVKTTLETVKKTCISRSNYGAILFTSSEGLPMASGEGPLKAGYKPLDFFPANLIILAMTYMYAGERDAGIELIRRCMDNIILRQRLSWDAPNILRDDTGGRVYGSDYMQMTILWGIVAAIEGHTIAEPCKDGGLVNRIIQAGKKCS